MTETKPKMRPLSAWDLLMVLGVGCIVGGLAGIVSVVAGVAVIGTAWILSTRNRTEAPPVEKKG